MRNLIRGIGAVIALAFLTAVGVMTCASLVHGQPARVAVPLVDRGALAAEADSVGVPRAAAYALAWMETRDGRCLPHCPRGPGRVVTDSTGKARRICREVGRMQINPCDDLAKRDPRCAFQRIRDNPADNYACGLALFGDLLFALADTRAALAAYNGSGPHAQHYAEQALEKIGEWYMNGALPDEDGKR